MYLGHKEGCQKSPPKFLSEKQHWHCNDTTMYGTYDLAKLMHKTHEQKQTNIDSELEKEDNQHPLNWGPFI